MKTKILIIIGIFTFFVIEYNISISTWCKEAGDFCPKITYHILLSFAYFWYLTILLIFPAIAIVVVKIYEKKKRKQIEVFGFDVTNYAVLDMLLKSTTCTKHQKMYTQEINEFHTEKRKITIFDSGS